MNLNLPKYRCYKIVGAIRISKVEFGDTGATVLGDGHAVEVDQAFLDKHSPKELALPTQSCPSPFSGRPAGVP